MRAPTRASVRAVAGLCVLLAGSLGLVGCATLRGTMGGYLTGPRGITRSQHRLRHALSTGDFKAVLAWPESDALLRQLDVGIASYYAAQFTRSAAAFDTAALLADDRITASLSKDALALVTNDMARPYQPRRTERLFIPYYGMLAYARLDQWQEAAVEARRLVGLLAQYADDRAEEERTLYASLNELAGAVFERAGERNDARVAYRAARALAPARSVRDSAPLGEELGELVVVVERGFVAHLATETMELELGGARDDRPRRVDVAGGDWGHDTLGRSNGSGLLRKASAVMTTSMPTYGRSRQDDDDDDDRYHVTIAFPAMRRAPPPWGGAVRVGVDDDTASQRGVVAVVDDGRAADERRERAGIVTRAAARAAAKYAVTKAIEDKKGEVAGNLANLGASLLERADVRSWHLLPQEITLVRLRLPAGTHRVQLRVGDGAETRVVELGTIAVRAGRLSLFPVRRWQAPAPAPAPADSLHP